MGIIPCIDLSSSGMIGEVNQGDRLPFSIDGFEINNLLRTSLRWSLSDTGGTTASLLDPVTGQLVDSVDLGLITSDAGTAVTFIAKNAGQVCVTASLDYNMSSTADLVCLVEVVVPEPETGDCNRECGFDTSQPDNTRAAAVCDITFPDTQFVGGGGDCNNDADCDDGDPCTQDSCIGAVVFICENAPITGCAGTPQLSNGQTIFIEFDHTLVSFTVNGIDGDINSSSWTAQGLSPGTQELLIEWVNRDGANPQTGCHTVEIVVPTCEGTSVGSGNLGSCCLDNTDCVSQQCCTPDQSCFAEADNQWTCRNP